MANIAGFRPPQFSEDVNWLPPWLQPCESNQQENSHFNSTFQDLPCLNTGMREDANLLSSEEGRYKSCHLFLSVEDSSPLTCVSSSGNVPKFHLHLSSDDDFNNTRSQFVEISQAEISKPDHSLTSLLLKEKANKFKCKMSQCAGSTNLPSGLPKKCDNLSQYTSNNLDNATKHEDHVKLVDDEITAAVELSIAASEALLIHEIIDSSQPTSYLSASAILEVALQVKQARVEGYIEASNIMHEETSDDDYLSDLDDSTMKGAYEEVGLTLCASHLPSSDFNISQVQDTYSLGKYEGDENLNREDPDSLGVNSADTRTKRQPEDSTCCGKALKGNDAFEPFDNVKQMNISKNLSPGPEASEIAFDMILLETPEIISTTKVARDTFFIVGLPSFSMNAKFHLEDITSLQATENTSHQAILSEENETKDLMKKAQEKFQSRWFGGWTHKAEVNAVVAMEMEHNSAQSVPAFVIGETSILSESADVAPDENSFVHKEHNVSSLASQSSVLSKRSGNENIETTFVDEDIMNSLTSSVADPLCSVVPCSISLENTCSNLAQNHEGRAETSNFVPIQKHNGNKPEKSSNVDNLICRQEPSSQVIDSVVSQLVRRQVTSLKSYSMLLPRNGVFLDEGKCNQSFPLQCQSEKLYSSFQSSMAKTSNSTRNLNEPAKETSELVVHEQKETYTPINSNASSRPLPASKSSFLDIDKKENLQQSAFRNKDDVVLQMNDLRMAEVHNGTVPGRKRVRFAEANTSFPQKRKTQMMDATYSNQSTRRKFGLIISNTNAGPEFKGRKRRPSKILDQSLKRRIFQNIKFLLTGFSSKREKEIEGLIRTFGGIVLSDIPSPPSSRALWSSRFKCQPLPVILCSRKLQTVKFLYGCAIKACLVTVDWLKNSICAGSVLPTKKYMILPNLWGEKSPRIGKPALCDNYIFDRVGIVLHGKPSFCNKIAKVIKHGGGHIFKTLHVLVQNIDDNKLSVGAIVTDDESGLSRHLKHCALERKIPLMPESWIIQSLYAGKLLPFVKNKNNQPGTPRTFRLLDIPVPQELSQEI
ncbi:uncharacterized protein LOC141668819 isoform X2 [Apium graveolens]|uniref:uncharacterized protein LOC141668819 isoform X2 n=1 Tax=Apium graveolens TaxID=4045 RepID=UPI003D79CF55